VTPLPDWLVDWVCDTSDDVGAAIETARAWREVLDGREPAPYFDFARYRELRARAVGPLPFNETHRTGFWKRVIGKDAP
jgi:hypothetical protein